MNFNEYRERISIGEMAEHLGYKKDPGGGRSYQCYYLGTPDKKEDEIVIYNPSIPGKNTYFSRKGNDKGNLINFVLNRLDRFPSTTKNGFAAVNEILNNYINGNEYIIHRPQNLKSVEIAGPKFNYNYWDPKPLSDNNNHYLTKIRSLSSKTIEIFKNKLHIYIVGKSKHIGFPFRHPGQMEITNFELRNYFEKDNVNYKGFCTGGDKSSSCWIANFVPFNEVDRIYLFESAIDAMSFFEIENFPPTTKAAFVSIGGHVTKGQIQALKKSFPNISSWNCCYDKDASGQSFDVATHYYLNDQECKIYTTPSAKGGKEIHITINDKSYSYHDSTFSSDQFLEGSNLSNKVNIIKPPKYKDWNEYLKYQKSFDLNLSQTAPYIQAVSVTLSDLRLRGYTQIADAIEEKQQEIISSFISQKAHNMNFHIGTTYRQMNISCSIYMGYTNLIMVPKSITISDKLTQKEISANKIVSFLEQENINIFKDLTQESIMKMISSGLLEYRHKKYECKMTNEGLSIYPKSTMNNMDFSPEPT